jgi:ParB/RepB/Spo0J family partition protein
MTTPTTPTSPIGSGRGTLKDLLSREAAASASSAHKPSEGRRIAIDLLDPNPFQHRAAMDDDKLEELAASIAANGQLEAVPVRPHPTDPSRFQLIAGHRRTEAFKRLRQRAPTEAERLRYSQVEALVKPGTTDRQMRIWGVVENAEREDTSPVEQGAALADLQEKEGLTVEQLIEETGMDANRVRRLLRIAKAPEVIRTGCTKGIMVQLYNEDGQPATTPKGRAKQEHRHLDLMAGLEFAALHAHFVKEGLPLKKANERLEKLIAEALGDGWAFRRIQERCKELKAGRAAKGGDGVGSKVDGAGGPAAIADGADGSPERPLFRIDDRQVVIYKTRLGEASPSQKATLRAALQKLIAESLG